MQKHIRISRSGLKFFLECPRCFWLDVHHRVKRPPGYPYTLSSAVDTLVKREFDGHRVAGELPPVFDGEGLDAKLYAGSDLETWRNNFKGIAYTDEHLNATLYGAVDDVLQFPDGSLAVVDYKSTGSAEPHVYDDYQKQMDTYSHILNVMGFATQSFAYFVFYVVDKSGDRFDNRLPFSSQVRRVPVDPSWVGGAFERAIATARQAEPPQSAAECKHCAYVQGVCAHAEPFLHATASDRDYVVVAEE